MVALCLCGRVLHYSDPAIQALVDLAIEELGPTVACVTPRGTVYVPRHYVALHGIDAASALQLARAHGLIQVAMVL